MWEPLKTSGKIFPPRAGHTTVPLGSNLFVFGGFSDAKNLYDDLYVLNVGKLIVNIFLLLYFIHFGLVNP